MATTNVVDLLVKVGVLDDRQHDAVMSRSKSGSGGDLVREIGEMGFATESTVARVLSVELALPRMPAEESIGVSLVARWRDALTGEPLSLFDANRYACPPVATAPTPSNA